MMIPILLAMQGHPESPQLWEKHADEILQECGHVVSIHKPCLYSGSIQGKRVILKQQVDDFAIAVPNKQTANILLDMINDRLMILMKSQGYIDMYNGINVCKCNTTSRSLAHRTSPRYVINTSHPGCRTLPALKTDQHHYLQFYLDEEI
jgi:hypothetical protein